MKQSLLEITQSYGKGSGDTISIRGPHAAPNPKLKDILLSYSCYEPIIDKIFQCLQYSGRYDCEVQTAWFRNQYKRLKADLKDIGLDLFILRLRDDGYTSKLYENLKKEVLNE